MSDSLGVIGRLSREFSNTNLIVAFRSLSRNFRVIESKIDLGGEYKTLDSLLIGEVVLTSGNVSISSHKLSGDLSERTSKKKQFELAKKFLKLAENQKFQAGIFTFYDDIGNFRMSLIYAESDGARRLWNNFRRSTYFVSPKLPNRTFIKQLQNLSFSSMEEIKEAFSITAVTNLFYDEFFVLFDALVTNVQKSNKRLSNLLARDFVTLFVIRIIFLGFIQKKAWIGDDKDFLLSLWKEYLSHRSKEDNFYYDWLIPLFFEALNSPYGRKLPKTVTKISQKYQSIFANAPYLNGGLFKPRDGIDNLDISISDEQVFAFFEFLFSHSFTIEENSSQDEDLQLNPEFLGIIFERLVNGENGAVYTPRPEVDFMCRSALAQWLTRNHEDLGKSAANSLIFRNRDSELSSKSEIPLKLQKQILESLETLSICDPAVGSGAFLVGMIQVIEELTDSINLNLGQNVQDRFDLKRTIVRQNLFGVEIKEWAVWICQLRLWLTIFIEAPDSLIRSTTPILPNLDFKIRQGDSLVQLVGNRNFPVASVSKSISAKVSKKVEELRNLKLKYFENLDDIEKKQLEKKEVSIYTQILEEQVLEIDAKIPKLKIELENEKSSLFGTLDSKDPKIFRLENYIHSQLTHRAELQNQKKLLAEDKPLVWSIEFSEIFSTRGGFDIVIGNPPYIRQENIEDPLGRVKNKSQYKEFLKEMVITDFPEYFGKALKISSRSDLYAYFYIRSLRLLNENGVHVFICSNSWLDVEYGAWLQKFLLDKFEVVAIYESSKKRSFSAADVNTVISIISTSVGPKNYPVKFVNVKSGFEDFAYYENVEELENTNKNIANEGFRSICIYRDDLIRRGSETENSGMIKGNDSTPGLWIGDKWGSKYLRSPDGYNKVVFDSRGKFKKLSELAEIKFGLKAGVTEFFFIDQATVEHWGIEERFLIPMLDSVQDANSYYLPENQIKKFLFSCEKTKAELKNTSALNYIIFGEGQKNKKGIRWPDVTSVQGRKNWYSLGDSTLLKGDMLSQRLIRERFYLIETANFIASDYFFIIRFINRKDKELLMALMNGTFTYFQYEIFGRTNQTGVINIFKPELNQILIPDPTFLSQDVRDKIIMAYKQLRDCSVPKILDELGFDSKLNTCTPNPLRKELDLLIYKVLGYTELDLQRMYLEFALLVQSRKAKEGAASQ